MDPRLKLQYYKDNNWEESFIREVKRQVTELWISTYKVNTEVVEESLDNENDDLYSHIFKKQKLEKKDELSSYLCEEVVPSKTDILAWWKVYFNIFLLYYKFIILLYN
jgi:hypothetical protein